MTCNNCGKDDHLYKNCKEPITSFGIICYHVKKYKHLKGKGNKANYINKNIKYLMIRKRNTFAYIEFIRAKYDLLNPEYIQKMFNHMTEYEKYMILNNKFNYLWNKLWLIEKNGLTNPKNKSNFYKGIIKFNILKNGYTCETDGKFYTTDYFINNCNTNYKYPEWFFPKGRKNKNENNIDSAKREFMEETNINITDFNIIYDLKHIEEKHTGTNGIDYKTIFYISEYNRDYLPFINYKKNYKNRNEHQKQEVGDIKWLSHDEVKEMFRDYETEKKNLFINTHNKIVKYLSQK